MEDNVIEQLIILANVTQDDIDNSVVDEFGVHYSNDGKRLIKGADIEEYCIKDGTEIICCSAFKDCKELSIIHFPSIRRRYVAGISNLFRLFMREVDYWEIYDNSEYPAVQIATGGKYEKTEIKIETTYNKIAEYVK